MLVITLRHCSRSAESRTSELLRRTRFAKIRAIRTRRHVTSHPLYLFNEPRDIAPSWETFKAGLREADAAICTLTDRVDTALLAEPTRLKILANYAVGYNNIDLAAATAKGIVVTNTPDVLTDSTADLTWALILAVARRVAT